VFGSRSGTLLAGPKVTERSTPESAGGGTSDSVGGRFYVDLDSSEMSILNHCAIAINLYRTLTQRMGENGAKTLGEDHPAWYF